MTREVVEQMKLALSVSEDNDLLDSTFEGIVERITQAVLLYIEEVQVPRELEWVIVEASISRASILGSEGYESESIEGQTTKYKTDPLKDYYIYLDSWARANKTSGHKSNKVRFY